MRVLITGSTGLVGTALVRSLTRSGDRMVALVRGPTPDTPNITRIQWDAFADTLDLSAAGSIDAVVHLAGASIAGKRWSLEYKALIRDSRVLGTKLLSRTIAALDPKPPVLVMASAMGYYGDRGEEVLTEESPPSQGFLSELCVEWERAADAARDAGIRVAALRFGNILARDGGMLKRLGLVFKTGFGGRLGSGEQWWPWIAIEDVARVIRLAINEPGMVGPVNSVAPGITRQADFAKELARTLRRPAIVPAPAWAVRLVLGELADDVLASKRMAPKVLKERGFEWRGPDLPTVFEHVFRSPSDNSWR